MASNRYLTTTLPYVNAEPHLGFALELVQADAWARYQRSLGRELFFNTGTDEHGGKIFRRAQELKQSPPAYVDAAAARFRDLLRALNITPEINFTRTTDAHHIAAAQEFWRRCAATGDIYKKNYRLKYCVGCELEKTDSELVAGHCSVHPQLEIEEREEENYFFRFSRYQQSLLDLYQKPDFIIFPASRLNEIRAFVGRGLEDFSISRLKTKMPWGVAVPDDPDQVMYVWFDALINYISALGWPEDEKSFNKFWRDGQPVQFAGKDNLRQQAAMWPAMLLSAGLPLPHQIVIHGFITSDGQKMSKSLGNVIDPFALIDEYGPDAVRYYLLRHVNPFEDSDFTLEKFKEAYNANLANGLGNLVSRVMKMAETASVDNRQALGAEFNNRNAYIDHYEFGMAMDKTWSEISDIDSDIQKHRPFELIKTSPDDAKTKIEAILIRLAVVANRLRPLMPQTSQTITKAIASRKKPENLFPRK